jgi:5-methylcytosine-specific restriction enzyme subunit McrC
MSNQIRQGLTREYLKNTESLSNLKGRIDVSESIKRMTMLNRKMVCSYDEFSVNSYMNRIIKTTLEILIRADISSERKKEIRSILDYLSDIETVDRYKINWKLRYDRNNQHYRMLISVCYLTLEGLLQTTEDGKIKTMSFLDEQKMHRLYEKFLLEFYRREFQDKKSDNIKVNSKEIKWVEDDNYFELLPAMQSDVMIEYLDKILIIDAKFYSHELQEQFGKNTAISGNLYQIFTYVKNQSLNTPDKKVSGMLLYAQTEDEMHPDNEYKMSGNNIAVRTLNLGQDFSEIKKTLEQIFYTYFGEIL